MRVPIQFQREFSLSPPWLLSLASFPIEEWQKAQAQMQEDSSNYPDPIALLDGVAADRSFIPSSSVETRNY